MAQGAGQHKPRTIGTAHTPRKHKATTDKARGSARERGYTAAWDRFSKSFLRRNPLCEYCLAKGRTTPATLTDHDLPHRGDPELFWGNTFTALCAPCHNGTKARLEARHSGDALLAAVQRAKGQGGG